MGVLVLAFTALATQSLAQETSSKKQKSKAARGIASIQQPAQDLNPELYAPTWKRSLGSESWSLLNHDKKDSRLAPPSNQFGVQPDYWRRVYFSN